MKRVHAPRGILNVEDKQETLISSRGMLNVEVTSERFNNRFIFVGVDFSIYALLTGERSSYSPV